MLSQSDIDFIKGTRKEITQNRTMNITLIGEVETGENPITKEPIVEEVTENIDAVVTEITSAVNLDRDLINGVEVEEGDLWVDVDLDDLTALTSKDIKSLRYLDDDYTVMATDLVGLGELNRVTMVGRLTG